MFIIKDLKYRAVTFAGQREKIDDWVTLVSMSVSTMILREGLWGRNTQTQNRLYYCTIPGSTVPLTDISTVTQSTS